MPSGGQPRVLAEVGDGRGAGLLGEAAARPAHARILGDRAGVLADHDVVKRDVAGLLVGVNDHVARLDGGTVASRDAQGNAAQTHALTQIVERGGHKPSDRHRMRLVPFGDEAAELLEACRAQLARCHFEGRSRYRDGRGQNSLRGERHHDRRRGRRGCEEKSEPPPADFARTLGVDISQVPGVIQGSSCAPRGSQLSDSNGSYSSVGSPVNPYLQ